MSRKPTERDIALALNRGAEMPYDAPEIDEPGPPASDWAHFAARGIIADLSGRRSVKWGFEQVTDPVVRAELTDTMRRIILAAEQMKPDDWLDIGGAPQDGTLVMLRRIYQGTVIAEGVGFWGVLSDVAPARFPVPASFNSPTIPVDAYVDQPKWLKANGMYAFPTPTHWKPASLAQ